MTHDYKLHCLHPAPRKCSSFSVYALQFRIWMGIPRKNFILLKFVEHLYFYVFFFNVWQMCGKKMATLLMKPLIVAYVSWGVLSGKIKKRERKYSLKTQPLLLISEPWNILREFPQLLNFSKRRWQQLSRTQGMLVIKFTLSIVSVKV